MTDQMLNDWPIDVRELRAHIEDLEQALSAIRNGSVDAVMPGGESGEQLYSLVSADRPYRVIVEEMGDGALTISESGIILYANRRSAELVGARRTTLLGRHVTELIDPQTGDVLADLLTAVPGATRRGEISFYATGRASVPVLASVTGLEIDGAVVRCLIAADLTDRRRAEHELARSAAELREAQRICSIGSWRWNSVTDELTWSAQMYRIVGTEPQPIGLTSQATLTSTHPEDATLAVEAFHRALIDRQPFVVEQRLLHPDGDLRHTVTRGEVVRDPDSGVRMLRGTMQDVTEERRSAAAVVEAREALVRRTTQLALEHRVTESLQRAVLPARLPRIPRMELAAQYLPADRPSMVGGDWYDAFVLPGGDLAIAVGDVVGHDVDAGAMMGQLRNALHRFHGAAHRRAPPPVRQARHGRPPAAISAERLHRAGSSDAGRPLTAPDALHTASVVLAVPPTRRRCANRRPSRTDRPRADDGDRACIGQRDRHRLSASHGSGRPPWRRATEGTGTT
jgi:sigma-B regulation protein RsbU (phosphoserine phosphatase)